MSEPIYRLDERVRRWVWILGLAGLIPFVAHTVVVGLIGPPFSYIAVASQILYAALILTFIGALHWGVLLVAGSVFTQRQIVLRLIWSVTPSLAAFVFAQLTYPKPLLLLAACMVVALIVDWRLYGGAAPTRTVSFLPLRLVLTVVASSCLVLTWLLA